MLTLVRVMPASVSVVEKQEKHLFPGDTESDFVNALKRSEVALAKILQAASPALLSAIRDQPRAKLADLDERNNVPSQSVSNTKPNQVLCFSCFYLIFDL